MNKERAETKLDEIAELLAQMARETPSENAALYSGDMGKALFFAYYDKLKQNSEPICERTLENCFDAIGKGFYFPTYCDGISGALYGMKLLADKGFMEIDMDEAAGAYKPYLENMMRIYLMNGSYDFMHAAIGIGLWLLKRGKPSDLESCVRLVDELERWTVKKNDAITWLSKNKEREDVFNIAMSHGTSSIAIFLTRMIKAGADTERCRKMLRLTVNYILQQEYKDKHQIGSCFPSTSLESESAPCLSRMGWCYGDLGIASAIWQAGCALNDETCKRKAVEILEFAAKRTNLNRDQVLDAGICHGTAGIAQIFLRMYFETKNETFAQAYEFWIDQTLKMAKWEDGLAGYKSWVKLENNIGWENNDAFLEGITGIGLTLISYVKKEDPDFSGWDEILLIS